MNQDFMFHFVGFLQETITTSTAISGSIGRLNEYAEIKRNRALEPELACDTLSFCQVALRLMESHSVPNVVFDQEKFMNDLRVAHKYFAAALGCGSTKRMQELNLEAFERFLSGDLVLSTKRLQTTKLGTLGQRT